MKSFVTRLFSRSQSPPSSGVEAAPESLEELYRFDLDRLKKRPPYFYPLCQVLKNQVLREAGGGLSKFTGSEAVPTKPTGRKPALKADKSIGQGPPRYTGEVEIGEGGTAFVFRATDSRLKREVALKRFKEGHDDEGASDYLAELESISRIRHPNVVSTFDADVDETGRFIVMELIDGIDAEERIAKGGDTFDVNRFTNFAIQSLEGLLATHRGGLLHLDLKPSNIMIADQVSGRDIVKIVDYGRALRLVDDEGNPPIGRGLDGSIYYAAPEQLLEEELDERTDLYSLGCVFYWVLSGKMPYNGKSVIEVMSSHLQHIVIPLIEHESALPSWLTDWVMGLISLKMEDRPASAQAAIDLLLDGDRE